MNEIIKYLVRSAPVSADAANAERKKTKKTRNNKNNKTDIILLVSSR